MVKQDKTPSSITNQPYTSVSVYITAFTFRSVQNVLLIFPILVFCFDALLLILFLWFMYGLAFIKSNDWVGLSFGLQNMQSNTVHLSLNESDMLTIGGWLIVLFSMFLALLTSLFPRIGKALNQLLSKLKFWALICSIVALLDIIMFLPLAVHGQQDLYWIAAMIGVIIVVHGVCITLIALYQIFTRVTNFILNSLLREVDSNVIFKH